jgi:SRSO17 transposase
VGLIIDESGHRKRGRNSVGVARQYLGSIGKVDNGQVGVFAALCQGDTVAMVDARLYLPKEWTRDKPRCKKAGIPPSAQLYRTKGELALEMITQMQNQIHYDWIGGDSIYGNSQVLRKGINKSARCFVMDISEQQLVYLTDPKPYIPPSAPGRGRKNSSWVSDQKSLKVKELVKELSDQDWTAYRVRQGTKGPIKREVYCTEVFIWSAKRVTTWEVEKLHLIISRNLDGSEVKYSLSNDLNIPGQENLSDQQRLYRQMQRYWVERGIQDCKDTLGMTDYQVRGWRAWYHHICLTIMALHFMIEQKIKHKKQIPLLSCPDIKFFFALSLEKKARDPDMIWSLIQTRHQQRKADLDRYKSKVSK